MKRIVIGLAAVLAAAVAAEVPLIQPADLAAQVASLMTVKPPIYYVGPNVLYRNKHIPGSIFAGMASTADGLEGLKTAVARLPRDKPLVIYCGCCPWNHCPNIKPAMALLEQMGFTKAKALYLPKDFKFDWIDKGYPVEAGTASKKQ